MNICEKVAYLKGLAEGLEISSDSKNGKILKGILDVLEDIADSIKSLEEKTEMLEDYITEIDEDLGALESDYEKTCGQKLLGLSHHEHKHNCHHKHEKEKPFDNFYIEDDESEEEDGDDDEDEDDWDDDYIYEDDDDDSEEEGDENEDSEEENENKDNEALDGVFEMKCPHCSKRIFIAVNDVLKSDSMSVECPECGYEIEVVEEEGCGCSGCGHNHANRWSDTKDGDDKEELSF